MPRTSSTSKPAPPPSSCVLAEPLFTAAMSTARASSSSSGKRISVTVFSDLACPWCYVGQKKLNAAVSSFEQSSSSKPPISVEWKPYMIDPNTIMDGEEFEAYNVRRWGSSGWTNGLKRSGRRVGANFDNWVTWPNTLKAHQLIAYVTDPAREAPRKPTTSDCNAEIFDAMYECGENVSLVETLVRIGWERLGVSEDEVSRLRTHLENNAGAREVMNEIQAGRRKYNIGGVPYFIVGAVEGESSVGRPYGFSGAQDSNTFKEIFEELAEKLE